MRFAIFFGGAVIPGTTGPPEECHSPICRNITRKYNYYWTRNDPIYSERPFIIVKPIEAPFIYTEIPFIIGYTETLFIYTGIHL